MQVMLPDDFPLTQNNFKIVRFEQAGAINSVIHVSP